MIKKTAIILAAGTGSRLKSFFKKPKCLMNFETNLTLIERTYNILKKNKFKKIIIVTGYKSSDIKKVLKKKVEYKHFDDFKKSNNLQTLLSVQKELNKEIYCFFADLVFDEIILRKLQNIKKKICMVIDTSKSLKNTMRVKIKKSEIKDIGSHIKPFYADGNFIGIAKFSKEGSILLKKYLKSEKNNKKDYYTKAIQNIILDKIKVNYLDIKGLFWKEIDTKEDYINLKKLIKKRKIFYA